LFSVRRATEKGAEVFMTKARCYVKYEGDMVMQATDSRGLWLVEEAEKEHSFLTREKETADLWHRRFGHAGFESLAKFAEGKLATGMKVGAGEFRAEKREICEPYILAKQTQQPFPDGESEAKGVLELVHMDVCRPMPKKSKGESRFFATFMDGYRSCPWQSPSRRRAKSWPW
jgi:hypothetical protein